MILIGRNTSPFVRRVAISLRLLGLPYEQRLLSTVADRAAVQAINPLGRIPALLLEDGEALIDSGPILDYLDELAGPEKALVPPAGPERRRVLKLVALALGAMEKSLACYVERTLRPADKQHQDLLNRFADQARAGLAALDQAGAAPWLAGERLTQADISAVAALDFIDAFWPEMLPQGFAPRLRALRQQAYALPAFAETRP
ncbi:putative GST-like protein YibF [mine drainage metagenome]|uniref:Putative GST-like protein YibF n=1 Tax=mine drainage metagenome TaxID=410659 RepID=A0A1J5RLG0_9ZZZZ